MTEIQYYTVDNFDRDVKCLCEDIRDWIYHTYKCTPCQHYNFIFPVVKGGTPLAVALSNKFSIPICEPSNPISTDRKILVVDDIIDSGKTRDKYNNYDFACIHYKMIDSDWHRTFTVDGVGCDTWIQYWWECDANKDIEDTVIRQLQFIGEDPNRQGLQETPKRVVQSWQELYGGYQVDIEALMKVSTVPKIDQMILVKNIDVVSTCEHHMLPFIGKAHVAYIPHTKTISINNDNLIPFTSKSKVIGLSKISQIVDAFSKRLQTQERIGEQVCDALMQYLEPAGCACIIEVAHLCMSCRDVKQHHSSIVTSALRGVFTESKVKEEMINLIKL